MSDKVFQLGIDDSPESSFLTGSHLVLAVQEGDVEHETRVVATMVGHLLVLEVGVLDVAMLSELGDVDAGLSHSGPPALVS